MKTPNILNCEVRIGDSGTSLHCDFQGARYHLWLNEDRTVREPLYKNPPLGVTPGSKEDYPTRKLSLTSRFSAPLIAEMVRRMQAEGLYEKAEELYAQALAKEERECRLAEKQHLVIGADRNGQIYVVNDDGVLRPDIREAAVFAARALDQAEAIALRTDLEQRRLCPELAVITLTAGDLERLVHEATPVDSKPTQR